MSNQVLLEEGSEMVIDFCKLSYFFRKTKGSQAEDVVPVVVQDSDSLVVLMVAYVNEAAMEYSLTNKIAAFWSTSRNKLWVKGLTSGCVLELREVRVNCEQNSLLFLVKPTKGGVCHTEDASGKYRQTCFYRSLVISGKQRKLINNMTRRGK